MVQNGSADMSLAGFIAVFKQAASLKSGHNIWYLQQYNYSGSSYIITIV